MGLRPFINISILTVRGSTIVVRIKFDPRTVRVNPLDPSLLGITWLVETVNYDVKILFIIFVLLCFLTCFITQYLDLKCLISCRYIGTSALYDVTKIPIYRYIGY